MIKPVVRCLYPYLQSRAVYCSNIGSIINQRQTFSFFNWLLEGALEGTRAICESYVQEISSQNYYQHKTI
jgi:hypothetical protein